MDGLEALIAQGKQLVMQALLRNVALREPVAKALCEADAQRLAASATEFEAYRQAFGEASQALGVAAAELGAVAARNTRLRPLVEAALTLLNFAAANARVVDDETRNALLATEAAVEAGTTTLEQEQAFLKAYESLTKALAPITVETLDASTTRLPRFVDLFRPPGGARPPLPSWTLGRFINATIFIVVLLGTGISLAYYSVGATALAKYRDLQATLVTLKQKEAEASRDLTARQMALGPSASKAGDKPVSSTPGKAEEAAALNAVLQSKADLEALQTQRSAVQAELKAIPERLGRWALQPCQSRNLIFNWALCAGVDAPEPALAIRRIEAAAALRAASSAAPLPIEPAPDDARASAELRGTLVDVEAARTVVARMSDVYLPLLLGFLGAHAFILRRMSKEISEKTFAKGSAFNHIVRTGLGALAGLASTWLLTPEAVGGATFKALPTWALAFVAGYGIELVFAFMDRIIAAFTNATK